MITLARRTVIGLVGIAGSSFLIGRPMLGGGAERPDPSADSSAGPPARPSDGTTPTDWPEWAETPAAVAKRLGGLRSRAQDLRRFGAKLDGTSDDSEALLRALSSGAEALIISGPMRLVRSIPIGRPIALFGEGPGPHLVWAGQTQRAIFDIAPSGADLAAFVRNVAFDGIHARAEPGSASTAHLVKAACVRGLTIVRCRTEKIGLAMVNHQRMMGGGYDRKAGSLDVDPAVLAGFSATALDDLNEDIHVADNVVDFGKYQGSILRFNMARRIVAWRNVGTYANVSWWGGGGKRKEGGDPKFLRRVDKAYIADNVVRGANGGVYGNNGQNVIVARNRISDTTDVGVDFEGCHDCTAYENHVTDASNYAYATFFMARNIKFLRNYGEQTGRAGGLAERYGAKSYGRAPSGDALIGLRSAGFGRPSDEAVDILFADNELVYSGDDGFGRCAPSFFSRMVLERNRFRNVLCDWRYLNTARIVAEANRFTFDRAPPAPATIFATSARDVRIAGNVITLGKPFPAGSVAFGLDLEGKRMLAKSTATITDNRIQPASLPVAVSGDGANVDIRDNRVSAVVHNAATIPRTAGSQATGDDSDNKPSDQDGAA
jgi:hypothetical protein